MSNAMTVAPGTIDPASGRWPTMTGGSSSATVNDQASAGERLPARSDTRADTVWTPNPSAAGGTYVNRPAAYVAPTPTWVPSSVTAIVSGSTPIPMSATWNEMTGVRSAPDEPSFGIASDSTGGVTSATANDHWAGNIAFPDRSETATFTWWLPYARFDPGWSEKCPAANVPAADTSVPSSTT